MASKKNKTLKKIGFKATAAVAGFAALNIVAVKIRCALVMKKMNKNSDGNRLMHSEVFGKGSVEVNPDVNDVYLTCLTGAMDVYLKDVPKDKDIHIDLCSAFANVKLILPPGAVIKFDGVGSFERILDTREDSEEKEKLYTVYLKRRSAFAQVLVENIK